MNKRKRIAFVRRFGRIFGETQSFFKKILISFSKKGLTMNVSGGKLPMLMLGKSNKM